MSPDRYGEPDDTAAVGESAAHPEPVCRNGWFDRDGDRPLPCLHCRPWLAPDKRVRQIGQ